MARIRALNAVHETGTFSAAARLLRISQPAVSQLVREIEEAYRVSLFERRRGRLIPTALGRELASVTGRIQNAEREAAAILANSQAVAGGTLRIGLGNTMPGLGLAGILMRSYPRIELQVEMGNWAAIIDAIVERRLDVGILPRVPDESRFRRQICLSQRVVAVVLAGSSLARRGRTGCEELARHPLIFRRRPSSTQHEVDAAFLRARLSPRPVITLDSRDGVLEAVAHGMGVGFIWEEASIRMEGIARLRVEEIDTVTHEHLFCLADNRNRLVDLFFSCRETFERERAKGGAGDRSR